MRETEDPDELAARLEATALDDIETGAEATLDLEMLEDRLRLAVEHPDERAGSRALLAEAGEREDAGQDAGR